MVKLKFCYMEGVGQLQNKVVFMEKVAQSYVVMVVCVCLDINFIVYSR